MPGTVAGQLTPPAHEGSPTYRGASVGRIEETAQSATSGSAATRTSTGVRDYAASAPANATLFDGPFRLGLGAYPEKVLDLDGIDIEDIATALSDQTDYAHRWLSTRERTGWRSGPATWVSTVRTPSSSTS